jgi:hypothetical protein
MERAHEVCDGFHADGLKLGDAFDGLPRTTVERDTSQADAVRRKR